MNVSSPQIAQQLQSAARLLQSGDLARARALLEQLLTTQPGLPEAYWLLAGVLMRGGDFVRAERAVSTAIQLAPGNPSAHALLGEILACQDRMADAERALRQALKLTPTHSQAASLLLRVLQAQARHDELLRLADELIGRGMAAPEIWLAQGQALLALKRMAEAAESFRKTLAVAPGDASAHLGLAAAQIETGESVAAENALAELIKAGLDGAEVHYMLARALLAQNRHAEAESELRTAIAARPDFNAAQTNLAELVWMRTGDSESATANLDEALRVQPGNTELRAFKAKLLEWAERPRDALAELEDALARDSGNVPLHIAAAQTAFKFDAERALRHAEQARQVSPRDPVVLSALGSALLANGRAGEVLDIADRLLQLDPHDGHAIALRASAWRLLGDPRYAALHDYAQFVRPGLIDTPPGWSSLQEYLRDLAAALHKRHVLQAHPIGQTLRTGTQVDLDLEHEQDPAIRAFAQAIDGPIRRYMQAIGSGNDVLRSRNANDYKITGIWSVRLRAQGHHVNHYHPEGWLSSACYIELPGTLGSESHEGWIKFGESGIPTQPPLEAEHFVKPEPGLLVLFPSWMWHGTVPFSGGERDRRLTIAFDVVPF
ncbi:MAG TPA: tetratricopeptide repeat protein [Rhodanobacteraceae bacterium]|nr:tetratricopeptide repeat protein [Rhodanobacteraceae bacterium]